MKDNTNYGIDPNDDTAAIMAEIEKNVHEEQEAGTFGKDDSKKDYVDPRIDGLENLEDLEQANIADEKEVETKKEVKKEAKEEESEEEVDLLREKYYQERKKRKGVYAERLKLEQENEELRKYLQNTISSNAELYKSNLVSDLEKIKGLRKQALLGEDPDLLIEADDLYYKALMKLNQFEDNYSRSSDKDKREAKEPDEEGKVKYDTSKIDDERLDNAKDWLNNRPELIEGSKTYNPRVQKALSAFIEEFDNELRRQGRADDILSDDYLDVLDEFVDTIRVEKPKSGYKTASVGSVRNNFSSSSGNNSTIQVKLDSWEKDYAKNLGLSEKEYMKWKIEDIKESRRGR